MRKALDGWKGGISIGGRQINNLRYADDTTLLANSLDEMSEILNRVKLESEAKGLKLNVTKTKYMIVGDASNSSLSVDGQEVEKISDFNFLGAVITNEGGCSIEIRRRTAMARSEMIKLSNIWKDRGITKNTKTRLVQALIFPIATYACESWTMTKAD